jgi:mannose-6-phosphate isomerase-like protein (cupin superfamily)
MSNIISKHTAPHYFWGDQCDSWILADTEGLSVKQETMPAGTKEKLHVHYRAQQFFFILKGTATFFVDGEYKIIREQNGLMINPGIKHFIANETLSGIDFLVISQPSTNNDRTNL